MSAEAIGWVFRKIKMDDATAKFVLVAICNYANDSDQAWPSHATISRLTGLSKRSVQNSVKKLEDWGIISRVRRDREDGSETSAMVSIDLNSSWVVKDGVATAATGETHQVREGVATGATLEPTLKQHSEKTRPAKQQDGAYPEDFEAIWKQAAELGAPRTRNTSKKKAYDIWRVLSAENQDKVRAAIPIFAAQMRAEGRPEDKVPHFQFWLSGRVYETVGTTASAARAAPLVDWYKTATPEQWVKVLATWRMDSNWRAAWGPAPGKAGCLLPEHLLTEMEKYQISLLREPRNKAQAAE
jgi:DNA-binding Lrp family transcriptional regulator